MPPKKKNLESTSRKSSRAATPDPAAKDESFNCRCCDQPDSADDMVQCDQCDQWNHLTCAGVTQSVAEESFVCRNCAGKSRHFTSFSLTSPVAVAKLTNAEQSCKQNANLVESEPSPNEFRRSFTIEESIAINSIHSSSAPSAAEDAAKRGPPPHSSINMESTSGGKQSVDKVSAPSAAEVAAKRGAQLFNPDVFQNYMPFQPIDTRTSGTSKNNKMSVETITETRQYYPYQPTLTNLSAAYFNLSLAPNAIDAFNKNRSQTFPGKSSLPGPSALSVIPGYSAAEVASMRGNNIHVKSCSSVPTAPSVIPGYSAAEVASMRGNNNPVKSSLSVPAAHSVTPGYSGAEAASMRGDSIPVIYHTRASSKASTSTRSSRSHSSKLKMQLQRLEEEKQMQEDLDREGLRLRKEREQEYINKKYTIISQVNDSSDDEDEVCEFQNNRPMKRSIDKWIAGIPEKDQLHSTTNATTHLPVLTPHDRQPPRCAAPASHNVVVNQHHERGTELLENKQVPPRHTTHVDELLHCAPHVSSTPQQTHPQLVNDFHRVHQPTSHQASHIQRSSQQVPPQPFLTKNHIAARNLIRDLPCFDGKPSEWPLFIASYNRSTELGGFSNEENLIRLHKALKGDALEAVKSLIIQPNCVGRVIETLKMLYGRPELIINTLIRSINSTPSPKADRFDTIVTFAIAVQNLCATFEASGIYDNLNYPTLMQELVEKLPPALKLSWAIHKRTLSVCTLPDFSAWIYSVAEAANGVLVSAPTSLNTEKNPRGNSKTKNWNKGAVNAHYKENEIAPTVKCCICNLACTSVANCDHFLKLNRTTRWTEVRKHQLCSRCLKRHLRYKCESEACCGINNCSLKHHPLLHKLEAPASTASDAATVGIHDKCKLKNSNVATNPILFRIIPVLLYGENTVMKVFALLDDGSSVTLLDEDVAKKLSIKGERRPLCLKWTSNTSRFESQSELINLQISGTGENAEKFHLTNVHTVRKLALPAQSVNCNELQTKYEHLKGILFESYSQAIPSLLIGVNNAKLGQALKFKEGGWTEPIVSKTRLGWVVHGNCANEANTHIENHNFHICDCNDPDLRQLVNEFICNDTFGASSPSKVLLSEDDKRALEILNSQTVQKDGRYETSLLWKYNEVQLPDSYPMARRRLTCLQKRMKKDPVLAKILDNKIQEYEAKGYARKLTDKEVQEAKHRSWYLPIFPVENINKPGKIRIVWDAAATVCGVSLNSVLLKGPDQLTPLTSVIFKFREQKIAICGDIQEMFHQIKIRETDQHFQRFLWGGEENGQPNTYAMSVMTFGATCSPCIAHFVKNSNAERFTEQYPRAVKSIKENHYVDDLMDSVPSEEDAINLAQQIRFIHKQGGFHIRNWVSNSAHVLKALGSEPTPHINMNVNVELGTEKVLGMWWCTSTDCLTFKLTPTHQNREVISGLKRPTKREVLRIMMTIFDPLGLIACVLMYIKILLQDIWRSKIEWDEEVKDEEYEKWVIWLKVLPIVENVNIPRCYISTTWTSEVQLHLFVDASENGYAAVAYIRNGRGGSIETRLIGAKTRVAPLKSLSVPRLELQAALLGARFAKKIVDSHNVRFSQRFFWSDSKTVLCWLRSDHRRYKQFVACRVSEILDYTTVEEWKWISTKTNVADEATKWQKPPDLRPTSRWFSGPKFLKLNMADWPDEEVVGSTGEDLKTNFIGVHSHMENELYRTKAFSRWKTLLNSVAYVHRFIHNSSVMRTKLPKMSGRLTKKELQTAESNLFREAQNMEYAEEIADLAANKSIPKSSPILQLNPFLDENRILRANSRICLAKNIRTDFKYPVILPRHHRVTSLVIQETHSSHKHQNDETVVNILRQRFYIPHIRAALKAVKKSCQQCKNKQAKPNPPIMAPLPLARLGSFCRPFSYVGIDYFGPMTVSIGRRSEKRWGVLFTCLTVRAIHIEVANNLTADSCILCVRNFIARRGTPLEFHSDNGTNFHGAERELREAWANMEKENMVDAFTTSTTSWKFIPPASPHMGGCWERLIRSVKNVLYAIMPSRNPTDELLRSMLIEIENIINSRPLTYIPVRPENPEALTPNHFLLGSACGSKPAAQLNDDVTILRKNWLISQQFAGRFWKRWISEYLPTLTRRCKWSTPTKPLEIGDIVLVIEPNNARNTWPKGRIIDVKRSHDGQVRSATVQTQDGIYDRPAVKLALLDVKVSTSDLELPRGSVNANAPRK